MKHQLLYDRRDLICPGLIRKHPQSAETGDVQSNAFLNDISNPYHVRLTISNNSLRCLQQCCLVQKTSHIIHIITLFSSGMHMKMLQLPVLQDPPDLPIVFIGTM